jgi:hypothetical protein
MMDITIGWRKYVDEYEAEFISQVTSKEDKLEYRDPETITLNAKDGCVIAKAKDQII